MNFSRNAALWIFIVLLLFVLFNLFQGAGNRGAAEALSFSGFLDHVKAGEVNDVTIQGQQITGRARRLTMVATPRRLAPHSKLTDVQPP